jgi:hypothetical protein
MRATLWLALLFAGCNSSALDTTGETSYGLGCHVTTGGAFSSEISADGTPGARARIGGPEIYFNCTTYPPGFDPSTTAPAKGTRRPLIAVGAGTGAAGAYSTIATLQTDADGDDCESSSPASSSCNAWFQGSCSGTLLAPVSHVGDWLRGSFSCASLKRTDGPESVSIAESSFEIQLELDPPH